MKWLCLLVLCLFTVPTVSVASASISATEFRAPQTQASPVFVVLCSQARAGPTFVCSQMTDAVTFNMKDTIDGTPATIPVTLYPQQYMYCRTEGNVIAQPTKWPTSAGVVIRNNYTLLRLDYGVLRV